MRKRTTGAGYLKIVKEVKGVDEFHAMWWKVAVKAVCTIFQKSETSPNKNGRSANQKLLISLPWLRTGHLKMSGW